MTAENAAAAAASGTDVVSLRPRLKAVRRRASMLIESFWRCGFLAAGRLTRSRAQPWWTTGRERVLVIAPHPDDEAIACAGTILRHVAAGDAVVIGIATDGRLARVAAANPEEVAALRKNEALLAARRLGVERLEWLGLPEGVWDLLELTERLRALLVQHEPTIVYAPSRVDFHPEHFAVAHALARALDSLVDSGTRARLRVFQVQVPLTRILTNVVADVSGVLAESAAAMRAYGSQFASFESVDRRRHYAALAHRCRGPVEEFWELSAQGYAALHREPAAEWAGRFRRMRRFAWTDPLAYLFGNVERRRLRLAGASCGAVP